MDASRCLATLDEAIEERHLLKHPFYQTWTAGKLSRPALQGYARQYYKQVEAFPVYLAGIYTHCDSVEDRRLVLRNLIEEDHGQDNHPELWLRFAEGLGLTRADVLQAEALPTTRNAIATYRRLTVDGSAASGMGALYAYEALIPEVAAVKIAGLREWYDVNDTRALSFFVVHEAADREHREWDRELLGRFVGSEKDAAQAIDAGTTALEALWQLLDGVHARYVEGTA